MHSPEQIQVMFEGKRIVQMRSSSMSYDNIWHPSVMTLMTILHWPSLSELNFTEPTNAH